MRRRVHSPPGRRRPATLIVLACLAGGPAACAPGATATPPLTTAQRIISLAPSATEVLFEAGCGDRVVGVTSYCRYPAQATTLPKVGGYLTPSYEALVALRPDLVVILPEHVDARRYLTTLGLDVVEFDHRSIRGILDSIVTAGDLCGTRARADATVAELERLLRRVEARTTGRPRPRVVISVSRGQERGFGSLSAAGPDGVYHDLLLRAGGQNAVPPGPVLHPALSPESLIRLNPDAVVEFAPGAVDGTAIREEWRALPSLTAVARQRVFVFTEDFLPVPGPRLVRFTDTLAHALHPQTRGASPPRPPYARPRGGPRGRRSGRAARELTARSHLVRGAWGNPFMSSCVCKEARMSPALSNGYSVARQLLAPADLSGLCEAISETVDRTAHALRTPFEESAPDAPFDERLERVAARDSAYATALFHAVMADVHRDTRMQALASHEALRDLVARTLQPLRVTGQVIRPRAVVPSLSHAASPWHQDVLRPSTSPDSCGSVRLACWIPLADVDQDSGALELIPGTWNAPLPHVTNGAGQFHIPKEHLAVDASRAVPMRAGDVLVLDRFVPHRSLPVRAGHVRWAIVMWVKAVAAEGEA